MNLQKRIENYQKLLHDTPLVLFEAMGRTRAGVRPPSGGSDPAWVGPEPLEGSLSAGLIDKGAETANGFAPLSSNCCHARIIDDDICEECGEPCIPEQEVDQ